MRHPDGAGLIGLDADPARQPQDRDALHRDGVCDVVVEIPRGSRNKYEVGADGEMWFDRRLGGPAGFPGDYGYVLGAEGEDGDALDALVLIDEPTFPGIRIRCRVIAGFLLQVGDIAETKLLCVPLRDRHRDHVQDLEDLPAAFRDELDAFFEAYRMLEDKDVGVLEHQDRERAVATLTGERPAGR